MKQITTHSGFTAAVNEKAADDITFLDLICEIEDGNPRAYKGIIDKLFSAEDKARLYDHVRTDDDRIPLSAIMAEITDVIKEIAEKK